MATTVFERAKPAKQVIDLSLSQTRQSVFWFDDLTPITREQLVGTENADLVIVGAGYTGLWTAVRAKERDPDRDVVVVEAGRVGWAASGRNGGFCEASLTHGEANGLSRWPDEMPELERLGRENLDGIEATVERYGLDVDFERTGTLTVAVEPHQIEWVRESPGYLDAEQTRAQVNSPSYLASEWEKHDTALVHPAKLAQELARLSESLGVRIYERSLVKNLTDAGRGMTVHTSNGQVHAQHVVLATNVFPSLLKRNRLMTVPVYDYVLMTEPLSDEQLRSIGWQNRQGIADLANQFHYYRLTADNRILFGGYDAVYHSGGKVRSEYEDRPESHRKLASHFFTTFPQLEGIRFTHKWAGAIDSCSRFCAFFGLARKNRVAYAAGFTGLGVGASRFAADVMLDLLAGEETERTRLRMVTERPLPFPPEPFATIGVNAVRWSMDRADHREGRRGALLKTLDAIGMGFDS